MQHACSHVSQAFLCRANPGATAKIALQALHAHACSKPVWMCDEQELLWQLLLKVRIACCICRLHEVAFHAADLEAVFLLLPEIERFKHA